MQWPIPALVIFCIVAEVCRELCFKLAAMRCSPGQAGYAARIARQPLVWTGIGMWAGEALAWIAVLARLPLGLAFPIITLSYVAVPLGGMAVLGERMGRAQFAGAALVIAGVTCIGWSGL